MATWTLLVTLSGSTATCLVLHLAKTVLKLQPGVSSRTFEDLGTRPPGPALTSKQATLNPQSRCPSSLPAHHDTLPRPPLLLKDTRYSKRRVVVEKRPCIHAPAQGSCHHTHMWGEGSGHLEPNSSSSTWPIPVIQSREPPPVHAKRAGTSHCNRLHGDGTGHELPSHLITGQRARRRPAKRDTHLLAECSC